MVTDKVSIYLLIYFKVLFMFTHAIQNNDIITSINNLNKVTLTNYTIIRIFLQQVHQVLSCQVQVQVHVLILKFVLKSGWTYKAEYILDGQNKRAFPKSCLLKSRWSYSMQS